MNELLEKEISSNSEIKSFLKKLENGKANGSDVSLYGANLGECVARIINRSIKNNMSWEELNDLAMPLFQETHEKVFEAASIVQKQEDKKNNIGIKPVRPDFPKQKIHDLIYKIYKTMKEQEDGV